MNPKETNSIHMSHRAAEILATIMVITTLGCQHQGNIGKAYSPETTTFDTAGGTGLPFLVGKDLRPAWNPAKKAEARSMSAFRMTDQLNQAIASDTLRGKVTLVTFFFTQCAGICPTAMKNLVQVQDKFLNDDRFLMLSFSVTPDLDKPDQLRRYAQANKISYRRWKLITGDKKNIYQLARDSFNAETFSPGENAGKRVKSEDPLHSENIYLLDQDLKLRGVYSSRMIASIRELISDAGQLLQ